MMFGIKNLTNELTSLKIFIYDFEKRINKALDEMEDQKRLMKIIIEQVQELKGLQEQKDAPKKTNRKK